MARTLMAALVALGILLTGCAQDEPAPLDRREATAAAPVDPAKPCRREAPVAPPIEPRPVGDLEVSFERTTNTVTLTKGQGVTLAALGEAVDNPAALSETGPAEWLLRANLQILKGASLQVAAPAVRWLKLSSGPGGAVSVKVLGGGLDITGSCVTSWDTRDNRADTRHEDGRPFLLARDGAEMNIELAEVRYLGHGEVESYGLSWRTRGTTGKLTNSIVSHNYFGMYSHEVDGFVVTDNEIHDNVLYGIDPHTGSRNLQIERNTVHHNGKHGIILAEDCTDSVIRDNVVYGNQHHGIVLYLGSNRNIVENNETFANTAQGINVNGSSSNTLRGNKVYDNAESGIGIGQSAADNVVEGNNVRGNQQDGLRLVSGSAATSVRDNIIGENARYGVYVDAENPYSLTGNTIFGSRTGVLVKGSQAVPEGSNRIYGNREADTGAG